MEDGPPKKKKSRFFSGGKSLISNIQSTFRHRDTTAPAKATKTEETSFETASTAFSKTNDTDENTEEEISNQSQGEDDTDTETPEPGRVATAAAALKNLSVSPDAKKRQGISPEEFKVLTSKTLLPTANPSKTPATDAVGTSSTDIFPKRMFSGNVPTTRRPPTPPVGAAAPGRRYQEERQNLVHRNTPTQLAPSSSSHRPVQPPPFPNLHPPSQQNIQLLTEDPSKPATIRPHLGQPFLRRRHDPIAAAPPPSSHPITNIHNSGITNLPLHATLTPTRRFRANATILGHSPSAVPPTDYMSPDRVKKAAAISRKRKRAGLVLPPPAFIYKRTNSPDFNIFPAILLYPELCFHLSAHLPVNALVSLYAISRDFHTILDTRFTTVVLSQSLAKAPECSRIFPFRCYAHLCRTDPASRIPHPDPVKAKQNISRAVPSFRWLRMVIWREKVVHEIMTIMAEDGVPLPSRCSMALKRMWFILDIPDNARRIGYIHSNTLVPDLDLYFMMCVFVKLDMRFNDPCAENVYHGLRKLVLANRSLTFLLRVLKRQALRTQYDVLQAWTRFRYTILPDEVGMSIFGVAAKDVGKAKYEYWGARTAHEVGREVQCLLRPEQLVMREAIRRGMRFHRHFLRCMLYGYIRPDTLENYAPRELGRRDPALADEYEIDDEVGGEELPGEGDQGRDPLLDLGQSKEVSVFCVKVDEEVDREVVERRKRQDDFLDKCIKWCRDERQWESMDGDV